MRQQVAAIQDAMAREVKAAGTTVQLDELRRKYLGRKGMVARLFDELSRLEPDERRESGRLLNELKARCEEMISRRRAEIEREETRQALSRETIDVTMPGRRPPLGRKHPISRVFDELKEIFLRMGFEAVDGPEVELDYYNFEALNIPHNHPARDIQDTFYVTDEVLLRTHTSPVQIRTMEGRRPPIRVIVPGRAYRSDATDASHSPVFHQLEGLAVDRGVRFSDLRGTLALWAKEFFGPDTKVRFRPHYFPFTEPSAEVDVTCVMCGGHGCRLCKMTGWLEVMGAGMVHPRVLENVGYDPRELSGFAFGMGVDRLVMLKYGVSDIRLLLENDMRFLKSI
ncbi:MAG TPA: phenylalanine--tRNA ligase subunit alpha [Firmicutes bacterium]|nr:phenylalanine--tRNA ligase subunit alpha [Bacillota bacterium]